jgi:NAD(P)-dependent dehydrogenase (short-subunit alcohol dehydrogenase family)
MTTDNQPVLAVTGGSHGIGRAVMDLFAQRGYAVSTIDPEASPGGDKRTFIMRGDVSNEDQVKAWIDETIKWLGAPTVLVNNAGIEHNVPFLELRASDFDRVIAVNLRGTFLCSQTAARAMIERGIHGAIVNVASTRAFMSEPNTEAYTASKGGIVSLTHAMAMSLGPHRIRVNCICPGWIETRKAPISSQRDHEQHPVGRVGTPGDVAQACLFIAEHAPFMTGTHLTLDGAALSRCWSVLPVIGTWRSRMSTRRRSSLHNGCVN